MLKGHEAPTLALLALTTLLTGPVSSQTPSSTVVLHGRVEDAATRQPMEGVLLVSGDSATEVLSDSLGTFAIPVNAQPPYVLYADQFGYETTTFELPDSAPERLSILVLDPEPLAVEGLTVVEDDAFTVLTNGMAERRVRYPGRFLHYDRARLLSLGGASAYDILRQRSVVYPCSNALGQICRYIRGRESPLLVCIDEQLALDPVSELGALPIESLATMELFGPTMEFGLYSGPGMFSAAGPFSSGRAFRTGQVRVYTRRWIVRQAGQGGRGLFPVTFGC